ncbi:hypothetical protein MICAC_2660002 [Microcystis aeruginosa PCC 9443]|uniref:Uncharacterized protein n=1 Tax=Microcystis aeruginosa PCC 9443 TaxID=1160281 RepID=I4G1M1_MICAE|nr:hypothetical protein MICAC_2660002 [Microcystis aeruginosa PCC 9443]
MENYQLSEELRDCVQVAQLQLGYAEKLFRGGRVWGVGFRVWGVGCGVWGVGFYRF